MKYICCNFSETDLNNAMKHNWLRYWEGIEKHPLIYMLKVHETKAVYYLDMANKANPVIVKLYEK